jgi:hypothetical protein
MIEGHVCLNGKIVHIIKINEVSALTFCGIHAFGNIFKLNSVNDHSHGRICKNCLKEFNKRKMDNLKKDNKKGSKIKDLKYLVVNNKRCIGCCYSKEEVLQLINKPLENFEFEEEKISDKICNGYFEDIDDLEIIEITCIRRFKVDIQVVIDGWNYY